MKKLAIATLAIITFSCNQKPANVGEVVKDNAELVEIYKADQADRNTGSIDRMVVIERDRARRERVLQLLDSNKVNTSMDYHNAAMVFQHGDDTLHYAMAVKLMKKSVELDSAADKWLLAAATDRYLLSKGEPQIYGTQYIQMNGGPLELGEMDTTVITDKERQEYGVETLAEQREKVKRLNRRKLPELIQEGKSIDDIISLIKEGDKDNPVFDISENGVNSLGYFLLNQDKMEEALRIFRLNTELYPDGFNTYDSYGECLLKMGKNEEALAAFRKSLELNPDNKNAEKIISALE